MSTTGVTVTVNFIGICTNISRERLPELPVPHRIVLVNASQGSKGTPYERFRIGPHEAAIAFGRAKAVPLKGCKLTLAAGASLRSGPQLAPDFYRIPNLTTLFRNGEVFGPRLSAPSREVVIDGKPARAACYFDVAVGTLTSQKTDLDAVFTSLTATGPEFVLEASAFEGGSLPEGLSESTVLTQDTTIWIGNTDTADKGPTDFILHYLTAQDPPADPRIPDMATPAALVSERPKPARIPRLHPTWNTVGAGCSNSNYP